MICRRGFPTRWRKVCASSPDITCPLCNHERSHDSDSHMARLPLAGQSVAYIKQSSLPLIRKLQQTPDMVTDICASLAYSPPKSVHSGEKISVAQPALDIPNRFRARSSHRSWGQRYCDPARAAYRTAHSISALQPVRKSSVQLLTPATLGPW